jgi:hypothetical protein
MSLLLLVLTLSALFAVSFVCAWVVATGQLPAWLGRRLGRRARQLRSWVHGAGRHGVVMHIRDRDRDSGAAPAGTSPASPGEHASPGPARLRPTGYRGQRRDTARFERRRFSNGGHVIGAPSRNPGERRRPEPPRPDRGER